MMTYCVKESKLNEVPRHHLPPSELTFELSGSALLCIWVRVSSLGRTRAAPARLRGRISRVLGKADRACRCRCRGGRGDVSLVWWLSAAAAPALVSAFGTGWPGLMVPTGDLNVMYSVFIVKRFFRLFYCWIVSLTHVISVMKVIANP